MNNNGNDCRDKAAVYVVATSIGNTQDMSQRAIAVLKKVDLICAEDSRQTDKLLKILGISNKIYPLHKYNENAQKTALARRLDEGKSIAIVSDAGTPLIADPGYLTLSYLRERQYPIYVVPGCCAVVAALSVSGLASDNFQFVGFVPAKAKPRGDFLQTLRYSPQTSVFFETPHRIVACLADCLRILGGSRQILIARELTKQFEESALMPIAEAPAWISANTNRTKGEFVLVLEASTEKAETNWQNLVHILHEEQLPTKTISTIVSRYANENKKSVYQYALSLQNNPSVQPTAEKS